MATSRRQSRQSVGRAPTFAQTALQAIYSLRKGRRRQRSVKNVSDKYKDKELYHWRSIAKEARKQGMAAGRVQGLTEARPIYKALAHLVEDQVLERVSKHGHFVLCPTIRECMDTDVPALSAEQQLDPLEVCKVISRRTKAGHSHPQHFVSPSPSPRKRRRTSVGFPLNSDAAGSENEDDDNEVRLQVTPARRPRASTASAGRSRRGSTAVPPGTEVRFRDMSQGEVIQALLANEQTVVDLRRELDALRAAAQPRATQDDDDEDEEDHMQVDHNEDQHGPGSVVSDSQDHSRHDQPELDSSPIRPAPSRTNTLLAQNSLSKLGQPPLQRNDPLARTSSFRSQHLTPPPSDGRRSPSPSESGNQDFSTAQQFDDVEDSRVLTKQRISDRLREEKESLQKELEELKSTEIELREQVGKVEAERDEARELSTKHARELESVRRRLAEHQRVAHEEAGRISTEHDSVVAGLRADLAATRALVTGTENTNVDLQAGLDAAQIELGLVHATVQGLEGELATVRTNLEIARATLEQERQGHSAAIMTLNADAQLQFEALIQDRDAREAGLSSQVGALNAEVETGRARITELTQERDNLAASYARTTQELQQTRDEMAIALQAMNGSLQEKDIALGNLQTQLTNMGDQLDTARQAHEGEKRQLEEELARSNEEVQRLQNKIQNIEVKVSKAQRLSEQLNHVWDA